MAQFNQTSLAMFTKHLSVMVGAGIPLVESLTALETSSRGQVRKLIGHIRDGVQSGSTLTDSLQSSSQEFDPVYLGLVRIGEESGKLDETLNYLSTQQAKLLSLRKKIESAMLYPSLVLGTMLVIGTLLALFVLPRLTDLFSAFESTLPLSTRILLSFANLMEQHGLLVIGLFGLAIILIRLFLSSPPIKPWWHRVIFKLPLLGNFLWYSQIALSMRNLAVLLSSGVPILTSFRILENTISNVYLRRSYMLIKNELEQGHLIADSFAAHKIQAIPELAKKMLIVGEKTGKLEEMLQYVADYYEEEVDTTSKNFTSVLEPILLLIVGLGVAFLALSIIGPIYQITGNIGG